MAGSVDVAMGRQLTRDNIHDMPWHAMLLWQRVRQTLAPLVLNVPVHLSWARPLLNARPRMIGTRAGAPSGWHGGPLIIGYWAHSPIFKTLVVFKIQNSKPIFNFLNFLGILDQRT